MKIVYKLTNAEAKLAELLWNIAPIASMELIKITQQEFGWKKSTTFSVLKILIEKGIAQNEKSTVTMLCTREQFISGQSRSYVEDTFGGSLPKFITSFIGGKKLTSKQAEELRRLIDEHEGGSNG
ncbi:BlaI/MecI/CopY family transcriptional regulator [Anaerocolumna aminovalerica]|uniref:BlaI/MecI/CopY family transcriptional regulator n=1 Tax=Anaerocolumna aminovalerica TaxID=1527 RepID=UPI000BE3A344|nr:BlaI/MecI/CopY family transcriptional regulator [Anaerocolumna aminovalerica]